MLMATYGREVSCCAHPALTTGNYPIDRDHSDAQTMYNEDMRLSFPGLRYLPLPVPIADMVDYDILVDKHGSLWKLDSYEYSGRRRLHGNGCLPAVTYSSTWTARSSASGRHAEGATE